MITFRLTTDVKDDRRVVLTLPPEVPTGQAELVVTVTPPAAEEAQRTSAALLAAMAAEPHLSKEDVQELEQAIAAGRRPLSRAADFSEGPRTDKAK